MDNQAAFDVHARMEEWRRTRGWWFCVDCGAKITDPHPMCPPYHYMCPVMTRQENIEWRRQRDLK